MAVDPTGTIVVVGAGLAGLRTISALRRKGHTGPLILVGAETDGPYDRPPLSKAVLSGDKDSTALPFDVEKLAVETRYRTTAVGLDLAARTVQLEGPDGASEQAFDGLVIATGAAPIRLPGDGDQVVLRTVEDALALRDRLQPNARVVIVGGSWIGAEVATVALAKGCRVTCLEAGPTPLAQALGAEVAAEFRPWWAEVDLRTDVQVASIDAAGDETVVRLVDGTEIPADVVVTGIGVRPDLGWLEGSGLNLGRGIHTDEHLLAAENVVAVGDVCERWSPRHNARVRLEHWDEAGTIGAVAAESLLNGSGAAHDPVPYFWSDQFGHKIQYVGRHDPEDRVELEHDADGALTGAAWFDAQDRPTAWLGVDRPRDVMVQRKAIEAAQ